MLYYFSGTGNSRLVAQRLAAALGEPLVSVVDGWQRPSPTNGTLDAPLGLVCPVHAWGLPRVVARFLAEAPATLHASYTYLVLTCGDDTGYAECPFREFLARRGLTLDAAFSVTMRNTYVSLPFMDVDPPALQAQKAEAAERQLCHTIIPALQARQRGVSLLERGNMSWLKTYLLGPLFRRFLTGDAPFRVDAARCTGCGRCQRVCPMKNVQLDASRRPSWQGHCTDCLACYHACPRHAITRGQFTVRKGQVAVPFCE